MALPGSATIPAVSAERLRIAKESGRRIVDLVKQGKALGYNEDGSF